MRSLLFRRLVCLFMLLDRLSSKKILSLTMVPFWADRSASTVAETILLDGPICERESSHAQWSSHYVNLYLVNQPEATDGLNNAT